MKLPCLDKKGLNIFSITADQRNKLGNELFLNTHFPIKYHRFKNQTLSDIWNEDKLFSELSYDTENNIRNKVFILYGAAGSGKSETMKWLEIKINTSQKSRVICRISRTELDPLLILQKVNSFGDLEVNRSLVLNRTKIEGKPVTLANNLIWNSLSNLLDMDENIIPISYKLRPIVERNIKESFEKFKNTNELIDNRVEIFSIEDLEKAISESDIFVELDYEKLRYYLVKQFEKEILGEYDFIESLKKIGKYLENKTGSRPLLLIDDLVQSMNIYSNELLNYFITFGECYWDVVIGLTPSSFEDSKRGRKLLTRIDNLDTFDDRVIKLWLSDYAGDKSYFLDEETIVEYAKKYIVEYKKINDKSCDTNCPSYRNCIYLQWGNVDDVIFSPFNKHLISRIFNSLPIGKGKARQFIEMAGKYVESLQNNETIEFFRKNIIREKFVDIEDENIRIFVESLMPLDLFAEKIEVSSQLLTLGGFQGCNDLMASVLDFNRKDICKKKINMNNQLEENLPKLKVIRDWLEDKVIINKELLKPFRNSCAQLIKEFNDPLELKRISTSKKWSTIKRNKRLEGCYLPIKIEDIDKHKGIEIKKNIGFQALKIAALTDIEENQENLNNILENFEVSKLIFAADDWKAKWERSFLQIFHVSLQELAFLLYVFRLHTNGTNKLPIIIRDNYNIESLASLPGNWNDKVKSLSKKELFFIDNLFLDWFQIRSNFFDSYIIQSYIDKYPDIFSVIQQLSLIKPEKVSKDYRHKNHYVKDILISIIGFINSYKEALENKKFIAFCDSNMEIIKYLKCLTKRDIKIIYNEIDCLIDQFLQSDFRTRTPDIPYIDQANFQTLDDDFYPKCLKKITKDMQNPIFIWHKEIHDFWEQVYQEVQRKYLRLKREIPKKLLGETLEVDKVGESINTMAFNNLNVKGSFKELNIVSNKINETFELIDQINQKIYYDNMFKYLESLQLEGYLSFFNSFSKLLSDKNQDKLNFSYYKNILEDYLASQNHIYYDLIIKNNDLAKKVYILSDLNCFEKLSQDIGRIIENKINIYKLLVESKVINVYWDNKYDDLLMKLSKDNFISDINEHEMTSNEIKNLINICQEKLLNTSNSISYNLRLLLIEMADNSFALEDINEANLKSLQEIIILLPDLFKKFQLELN